MTLTEFEEMPVIMSFFPLTFGTGRQKWTHFVVSCGDCEEPIPADRTRGHVEREVTGDYRTVQSTCYSVVAHGLCPKCNKMTTATYLLHEDMTCTGFDSTGKYRRWKMRRVTKWEKFAAWLRDLFTGRRQANG